MPGQDLNVYRRLAALHTRSNPRPHVVAAPLLPCDVEGCRGKASITFLFIRHPDCDHGPKTQRTSYCKAHEDGYSDGLVCSVDECELPVTLTPPIHLAGVRA